jgi:hypothetical protein
MMKTICRYELAGVENIIPVDENAKVLSVGEQKGRLYAWILVETAIEHSKNIRFYIALTGHAFFESPDMLAFHGTVQMHDGLVCHVFYLHSICKHMIGNTLS